jgi:hypothetical protein
METTPWRYLVIANQTLAEVELTEAIRERLEAGPSSSTCSFPTLMLAISPPGSPEAPPLRPPPTTPPSICWPPGTPNTDWASS